MKIVSAIRAMAAWAVMATALLGLGGCSDFDKAWDQAAALSNPVGDFQGRWEGTWRSEVNGHNGPLRAIVTKKDNGGYQARFHAGYGGFLTFEHQITLDARLEGNFHAFQGSADLGWLAGGVFHHTGKANDKLYFSNYKSEEDQGIFELWRPGLPRPQELDAAKPAAKPADKPAAAPAESKKESADKK